MHNNKGDYMYGEHIRHRWLLPAPIYTNGTSREEFDAKVAEAIVKIKAERVPDIEIHEIVECE